MHSPEPWRHDGLGGIEDATHDCVLVIDWDSDKDFDEHKENAERIVACINFCRGIQTEALQTQGEAREMAAEIERLRVELVAMQSSWRLAEADVERLQAENAVLLENSGKVFKEQGSTNNAANVA